jgi:hypothetical protein
MMERIITRGYAWVENWHCTVDPVTAYKLLASGLAVHMYNYTIIVGFELN